MRLKLLLITIALSTASFFASAQNEWDADNPTGNFSFCNNWYSDICPSTWNGTTDLLFQFRNSPSQTSLYFDLGGWRDVRNLQFNNFYGQSTPLNGDGNGFNIYGKLENNSSWNQNINVPTSFKGSTVEINAINADMVINSPIYNSNNRAINVFGSNGKLLTFNNYIEGNVSVAMNINQYSKVAIAHDMTGKSPSAFSGGVNINIGELWINTDSKLNGGTITLGGNGNICKLYINATNGTQVSSPIIVANYTGSTQIIGSFRDSGTNEYTGSVTLNRNVTFETAGGGTTIFTGVVSGNNNVALNNLTGLGVATIVYNSATSNTYTGTTTINSGTKLKISSNQTLGNIALNGGILEIDLGVTLTITGTYTSTGGTIDNKGTIKFAGGSVTFPGSATVNNGVANTLAGFEAASSGIVTLNTLLRVTNSITVSSGTVVLSGNDLRLNNATLNIVAGGTFDNGGENQIINEGGGTINISGTFITRDKDGFVGDNTVIPSITPTLNAGCTVEYGLNGNQDVQGSTAPTYSNVTFSGTGTKTLISGNNVTGTVIIKDAAIVNSANFTFGGFGTNLTMTGTSRLIVSGARRVPDMEGIYTLSGGTIEFAGNSNSHTARSPITYNNVVISGSNVNGSAGNYTLRNGATFTVNAGGVFTVSDQRIIAGGASATINVNGYFVTKDADGFYGTNATSISPTNTILNLGSASTIEYAGANQSIATVPVTTAYANITISGTGTKTIPTELFLGNDLFVKASALKIESDKTLIVTNKVVVEPTATMTFETNLYSQSATLIQINDTDTNSGNITYQRVVPVINSTDYTYWSSPVLNQNLQAFSPNTPSNKFYSFNAAVVPEDWKPETPSSVLMDKGVGYCIYGPQLSSPPAFFQASFIGKPNNGLISVPIKFNGASGGTSNLIGNPYPSAIDADKFLDFNKGVIDGTLYFWTHNTPIQLASDISTGNAGSGVYAYTKEDYASYNITGGVGITAAAPSAGTGGSNTNKPNGKISAGQAFFATSLLADGTATFNNNMRLDKNSKVMDNSQFFKSRNPKTKTTLFEKHRIWLNLTNSQGIFKQTLVGYITDATNQYDNRFDGETFDGNEFVDFYSVNQNKNLVIQGRALPFDENDEVPLGFRTTIEGTFTIKIDQADGVLTNKAVFIEDKLTNTSFDLRSGPYTFNTVAGTFNDRFVVRYTDKTLRTIDIETNDNQVLVSNKNKQIKINSKVEIIDKVLVYDLLGRQLFNKDKVNSTELSIFHLISNAQTLLVKVTLQNGQTVTKKIIY